MSKTTNTSLLEAGEAQLLPIIGSRVRVHSLKSAKQHNGKTGIVQQFDRKEGRFRVELNENGTSIMLGVKPAYVISLQNHQEHRRDKKQQEHRVHVLIPCHVDSDRRVRLFGRAIQSIQMQYNVQDFCVFVGLSGPEYYRALAVGLIITTREGTPAPCRWYLVNDEVDQRSQVEHLRHLYLRGSQRVDRNALITFLDNDDMCHPLRLFSMLSVYRSIPDDMGDAAAMTLAMPCKLLLDSTMTEDEGTIRKLIDPTNSLDYKFWKRSPAARRGKIRLVSNSEAGDADAEEYFDFIVPLLVLEKFFSLTPKQVANHRFCDLRLFQVFSYLQPMELEDVPGIWMIAHYKIREEDMWDTFDNHGKLPGHLVHAPDQSSEIFNAPSAADVALSHQFSNISPYQVAMSRSYIESIILSYFGWDEEKLEEAKQDKVEYLNGLRGQGFGDALWEECCNSVRALFDEETLASSKDAWKCAWAP